MVLIQIQCVMKNSIIILFTILVGGNLQAQYAGGGTPNVATAGGQGNPLTSRLISQLLGPIEDAEEKRKEVDISNIEGSPYTMNDFSPTVLFYKKNKVGKIFYRYNALNEEIEVKRSSLPEEGHRALVRDKNIYILVKGKKLSFHTFISAKNKTMNGYLTELTSGDDFTLYKRTKIKFTEGKDADNSFIKETPARFTEFTEYYIKKNGVNRIDQISQKKQKLLKSFDGPLKSPLKEYINANNLNIKIEEDLVRVIEFLNKQ